MEFKSTVIKDRKNIYKLISIKDRKNIGTLCFNRFKNKGSQFFVFVHISDFLAIFGNVKN